MCDRKAIEKYFRVALKSPDKHLILIAQSLVGSFGRRRIHSLTLSANGNHVSKVKD